jgi:hypothetical protein
MSEFQAWPSWRYGPDGQSKLCENEAEVPKGWGDHPAQFEKEEKPAKATEEPAADAPDVDASGAPFDPELHAATRSLTKDGLWRMKVGVKRPEAPAAHLDL